MTVRQNDPSKHCTQISTAVLPNTAPRAALLWVFWQQFLLPLLKVPGPVLSSGSNEDAVWALQVPYFAKL